ncbi:MAG: RNA polymerase sigma factor [Anaerolineaceae bacterium]|jgi:RNA polymerase sigma factor (sigma-70 family)
MILFTVIDGSPQRRAPIKFDEDLIARIGMDDKEAFLELYQSINQPLFAYILGLVADVNEAQDILQETYLKIRSAAHLYQAQGKPMAWIFTIARNLARMHFRQSQRVVDESIEDVDAEALFSSELDQQDRIVMKNLLEKLDEDERTIILLHAVSGYKHREISQYLEKPLSTVLSRYNRGIKKLRKILEQAAA